MSSLYAALQRRLQSRDTALPCPRSFLLASVLATRTHSQGADRVCPQLLHLPVALGPALIETTLGGRLKDVQCIRTVKVLTMSPDIQYKTVLLPTPCYLNQRTSQPTYTRRPAPCPVSIGSGHE
ncbi:hypothetical protein L209DRAFT_235370 [Thermothelomyces heterothallicus CBS 203.75]